MKTKKKIVLEITMIKIKVGEQYLTQVSGQCRRKFNYKMDRMV